MSTSTGTGGCRRLARRTRRWREGGSFSSMLLTFSLLLLVVALGFVFGRLVIARAYVRAADTIRKAPEGQSPSREAATAQPSAQTSGTTSEEGSSGGQTAESTTDSPDTTADPADTNSDTTGRDVRYALQVGAFGSEETARKTELELTNAGYPARIVRQRQGSRSTYKVLAGDYDSKESAQDALSALQRDGYSAAFVVEEPSG